MLVTELGPSARALVLLTVKPFFSSHEDVNYLTIGEKDTDNISYNNCYQYSSVFSKLSWVLFSLSNFSLCFISFDSPLFSLSKYQYYFSLFIVYSFPIAKWAFSLLLKYFLEIFLLRFLIAWYFSFILFWQMTKIIEF